ncbi:MAG: hypothetical protein MUC52_03630 [Candidatus Omnitrophica bacterium]|nr:hypothetical protein [Candidatus Omnitrophota bacterium]
MSIIKKRKTRISPDYTQLLFDRHFCHPGKKYHKNKKVFCPDIDTSAGYLSCAQFRRQKHRKDDQNKGNISIEECYGKKRDGHEHDERLMDGKTEDYKRDKSGNEEEKYDQTY